MPRDADRPGKGCPGRYRQSGLPHYYFGLIDLETDPAPVYRYYYYQISHSGRAFGDVQQGAKVDHRKDAAVQDGDASHRWFTRGHRVHRPDLHHLDDMGQFQADPPGSGTHEEKPPSRAAHLGFIRPSSVAIRPAISVTGRT